MPPIFATLDVRSPAGPTRRANRKCSLLRTLYSGRIVTAGAGDGAPLFKVERRQVGEMHLEAGEAGEVGEDREDREDRERGHGSLSISLCARGASSAEKRRRRAAALRGVAVFGVGSSIGSAPDSGQGAGVRRLAAARWGIRHSLLDVECRRVSIGRRGRVSPDLRGGGSGGSRN